MRRSKGFTLIEIMAIAIIISILLGTLNKIFSGTFLSFFKTQTKLTNLRAACLLLEHLKHDLRLSDKVGDSKVASSPWDFHFTTRDSKNSFKKISYEFDGSIIKRNEDGSARVINMAKVSKFDMSTMRIASQTCLQIIIEVDAEKDEVNRTQASKGNIITLSASLFPPFMQQGGTSKEEEYWYNARK
ncbi:MAG: prepilin-type N-terminal cleavage/methylation domain-containing protein [Candidatus Riflebacteria bacterium]|nr:prepilin-type N-terminal cleavage/methylation domain-containing protein [Candidatus Riflebacteria bacterium]